MKRTVILTILDGWGIGQKDQSNPIYTVNPSNIQYLKENYPYGSLQASSISVGLPWGEEGNSEIGHLNIGTGKIIYQSFPKISLAINDKSFFENEVLQKAFNHAKQNNSSINLIGLLTSGNIHASIKHLKALIKWGVKEKIPVNLHLITDGRDSSPTSALNLIKQLPIKDNVYLASISGRFYAMDRDRSWERTKIAYQAMTGDVEITDDFQAYIKKSYSKNPSDEYILPTLIGPENRGIKNNDAIIFFNFREDRMRQIVTPFADKNFNIFPVKKIENLYIATMTEYEKSFNLPVAFNKEKINNPLGKVLSDNDKIQLRIAETQKYPHITYFFNGIREEPFKNEYRILIPSKTVFNQAQYPKMMAEEITTRAVESINEKSFDFILINYANPDMVAHTGNFNACIQAVKFINEQIGRLIKAAEVNDAILIITSDHGNMECVMNPQTGEPQTKHDPNPVPIHLMAKEFKKNNSSLTIQLAEKNSAGILADIAPTILELMGLAKPKEMTGQSLLKTLL